MNQQQTLAECIRQSQFLLKRNLKGFDGSNYTRQPPGLPNHLAWTLGHLALTMHRAAEKLDGKPLPARDFVTGGASVTAFDTESVCFKSTPVADSSRYPKFDRCEAIFDAAIERFATAIASADDAKLNAMTRWGPTEAATWLLIPRLIFHNGTHNGQITDLRRALGLGNVLG